MHLRLICAIKFYLLTYLLNQTANLSVYNNDTYFLDRPPRVKIVPPTFLNVGVQFFFALFARDLRFPPILKPCRRPW